MVQFNPTGKSGVEIQTVTRRMYWRTPFSVPIARGQIGAVDLAGIETTVTNDIPGDIFSKLTNVRAVQDFPISLGILPTAYSWFAVALEAIQPDTKGLWGLIGAFEISVGQAAGVPTPNGANPVGINLQSGAPLYPQSLAFEAGFEGVGISNTGTVVATRPVKVIGITTQSFAGHPTTTSPQSIRAQFDGINGF